MASSSADASGTAVSDATSALEALSVAATSSDGVAPSSTRVEVFDQEQNSYLPYGKVASFAEFGLLSQPLLDACNKLNWVRPSVIQASALPVLLKPNSEGRYRNMIAQAKTGSGKTGAFVLTILERINKHSSDFQALILCHSRELAIQTYEVCCELSGYLDSVNTYLAVPQQRFPAPWRHQIVVGTPGTLLKQIFDVSPKKDEWGSLPSKKDLPAFLDNLMLFVIDEADELLSHEEDKKRVKSRVGYGRMGMRKKGTSLTGQVRKIWTTMREAMRRDSFANIQTVLTSATFPQAVKEISGEFARNPVIIKVSKKDLRLKNVALYSVLCPDERAKFETLLMILGTVNIGQAIVFCNTVEGAKRLSHQLKDSRLAFSLLYAGLGAETRDQVMDEFRDGKTMILVSSNVIARGLDVPAVKLVVNYDIPIHRTELKPTVDSFDPETFMHRTGRTGRFGVKGVCISFVTDKNRLMLDAIQKIYELPIKSFDSDDVMEICERLVKWVGEGGIDKEELKRLMGMQHDPSAEPPSVHSSTSAMVAPTASTGMDDRVSSVIPDPEAEARLTAERAALVAAVHAASITAQGIQSDARAVSDYLSGDLPLPEDT